MSFGRTVAEDRYVFSIGLVPVQEWIGEATRSRDLRAGSALLSWLMARMLARLQDEKEGLSASIEIPVEEPIDLFKNLSKKTFSEALAEEYGVPNRASGFLKAPQKEIRPVFDGLQSLIDGAWQLLKAEFLAKALNGKELSRPLWEDLKPWYSEYLQSTDKGADCPFSVVWVALPAPADEPQDVSLRRIDRAFDDVKRTRPIRPWRWGKAVGKCNQCGRREAVGPTTGYGAWRSWNEDLRRYLQSKPLTERGRRVDPGERLCPICLTRRHAAYPPGGKAFPSTGDVATAPWVVEVGSDESLRALLAELRGTPMGSQDLGRALLASEAALGNFLPAAEVEALRGARRELEQGIQSHNRRLQHGKPRLSPRPPAYLALLAFDGDDMGHHVRDRQVRAKMNEFAVKSRKRLTQETEAVFYLAGDEGLALLPAAGALRTALDLRQDFSDVFPQEVGRRITLSAGLTYFDYHRPLQGAIAAALAALESAKALRTRTDVKNALGVAVETASGTRFDCVEHWGAPWRRLERLLEAVGSGRLSRGFLHDAEAFLRALRPEELRRDEVSEAARDELRRLLLRRARGGLAERQALWEEVERTGTGAESGSTARWLPGAETPHDADLLHLVAFLSRVALPVIPVEGDEEVA